MNSTNDYSRVGGIVGLIRELYKSTAATLQEATYPSDREVKIYMSQSRSLSGHTDWIKLAEPHQSHT